MRTNISVDWKPLTSQQLDYLQIRSSNSENILAMNSRSILNLGMSTCPLGNQIIAGTTETISMTPSGGTPPYTINWKVDGTLVSSWKNIQQGSIHTFDWSFNESPGSHIYSAEIIDSCPIGTLSDSTSCTINIVQETTPIPEPTTPTPTPEPTTPTPEPTTPTPISESACQNCDPIQNMCILNKCIPKDYLIYGGIGLIVLLLMTK